MNQIKIRIYFNVVNKIKNLYYANSSQQQYDQINQT